VQRSIADGDMLADWLNAPGPVTEPTAYELIESAAALAAAAERWTRHDWLALDTEFVRESTYYPQLCLVQAGDGHHNICLDTLGLSNDDLLPLYAALRAPATLKVFHAASQDLEIFVGCIDDCPRPLFDTQLAAALLGDGDQLGYAALVEKRLGIKLDKSLTRTDWSRRPLTGAELAYAADDVRWLAELFPRLRDELEARRRLAWLEEDCARLADAERYRTRPEDAWRRLKGLSRLPPRARQAAAALAAWRERIAQARNRPRKWILDDAALYRLAERLPQDEAQLAALQVLPPKVLQRHAAALVAVIADSAAHTVAAEEPPLSPVQKAEAQRLLAQLRERADALGIPSSLLATRGDVETWVGAGKPAPLFSGWRLEAAGDVATAG
jgi:ribonuclease D